MKKIVGPNFLCNRRKKQILKKFFKNFFRFFKFLYFHGIPPCPPQNICKTQCDSFHTAEMAGVRKIVFPRLKNTPKSRGGLRAPPKGFRPEPFGVKPCLGVYNSTTLSRIRSVIWPNPETCCPSGKLSLKRPQSPNEVTF